MSSPIVAPDGSVYMGMVVSQSISDTECNTNGETITSSYSTLIEILKNGSPFQTIDSSSTDAFSPYDVIPDGNGGFLVSYFDDANSTITLASTSSGQASLSNISVPAEPDSSMVLGDTNTAFVTDGTNVLAFDATSIQQKWTYTSTGGTLTFINATPNGGVLINDSQLGAIQLDSNGSASGPVASLLSSEPLDLANWEGISNAELALTWHPNGSNGIATVLPQSSPAPAPRINPQSQGAPPFCQVRHCALAPIGDTPIGKRPPRDIVYGVYSFENKTLSPLYNAGRPFEIILVEQKAAQNTDNSSDTIICTIGYSGCNNYLYHPDKADYVFGSYKDELAEPHAGLTLAVTQQFTVSRQPVHVFRPVNINPDGSPWSGAPALTAVTTTSSSKVYLNNPDLQATACQHQKSGNAGCDKTGP